MDDQYGKLMKEAFRLSTADRRASDAKVAEADQLLKQMEELSTL